MKKPPPVQEVPKVTYDNTKEIPHKHNTFSSEKNPFGADGGKILLSFPNSCNKTIIHNKDIPGFDNSLGPGCFTGVWLILHSSIAGAGGGIVTADKLHTSGKN